MSQIARKTYTKIDLSRVSSQVKRQIVNKVKKGTIIKITKTEALDKIAKALKLSSSRTLWIGDTRDYLDQWFVKLEDEIQEVLSYKNRPEDEHPAPVSNAYDDINTLIGRLDKKNTLINEYAEVIKVLREENEKLRLLIIEKHGKIDL